MFWTALGLIVTVILAAAAYLWDMNREYKRVTIAKELLRKKGYEVSIGGSKEQ